MSWNNPFRIAEPCRRDVEVIRAAWQDADKTKKAATPRLSRRKGIAD
jgi:hypothetical protein